MIDKGEGTILTAEEDFAISVREIEKHLLREINKIFNEIDAEGGKIRSSDRAIAFLNSIEKRIDEALKKAGYQSTVNNYLKNFEILRQNNIDIQAALNGETISYSSLNDITKLEIENTWDKLVGSGISRDFKIPVKEALYRNVTLGTTIAETKSLIESYIISNDGKDSRLLRYTTQVARDSISQYDGSIQTVIKNALGLSDFLYSGSIIKDSRCQCRYWVNKQKLDGEELAEEIEIALDGRSLGGCPCSGMIPGTNVQNFSVNRGGYSCRHRAIATNL